ncbi:TRAP transporter small permease [Chloroflexota bacterium]
MCPQCISHKPDLTGLYAPGWQQTALWALPPQPIGRQSAEHIGVEILSSRLPARGRKMLEIVGSIALLVYAGFIIWASWGKTLDHLQYGERSIAIGIPLFTVQLIVAIALLLLCLQALVNISKDIAKLGAR